MIRSVAILAVIGIASVHADDRREIPGPDELKAVDGLVREVFGDAISGATTPEAKVSVARNLLNAARDSKGKPIEQFALLREAQRLATESANADIAMHAITDMAATFRFDQVMVSGSTLYKITKAAKTTTQRLAIAQHGMRAMQIAAKQQRYVEAQKLGKLALDAAKRSRNFPLSSAIGNRLAELGSFVALEKKYEAAEETLKTDAKDAAANLTVGKYLCFVQGNWERGLSHLELSGNAELLDLAKLESSGASTQKQQIAVGDRWWQRSLQLKGLDKEGCMLRAGAWYETASSKPVTGLTKVKLDRRLSEAKALGRPLPQLTFSSFVDTSKPMEGFFGTDSPKQKMIVEPVKPLPISGRKILGATFVASMRVPNQPDSVIGLCFSPDSKTIAAAGKSALRFWSVTSHQVLSQTRNSDYVFSNVVFLPDGKRVVTAGSTGDRANRFFDSSSAKEVGEIKSELNWLKAVAVSGDGGLLATGGDGKTLSLWDVERKRNVRSWDAVGGWMFGADFSPDGNHLATCGQGGGVRIWNYHTGKRIHELADHKERVWSVAYSPDGKRLVSSAADNRVIIWDPIAGRALRSISGHSKWVRAVDVSPNGQTVLSASFDQTVALWDIESGRKIVSLKNGNAGINNAVFSPDGKWLAAGDGAGVVLLWELTYGS